MHPSATVSASPGETLATASTSRALERYERYLDATMQWLRRSVEKGHGGSSTYFGAWGRWAKPYPETTGYIIPTFLDYAHHADRKWAHEQAVQMGRWLLDIQQPEGYWHAGSHPPRRAEPSVFNTGQILLGLVALHRETGEEAWLQSAHRAAKWLCSGVDETGLWTHGNYLPGYNPSYYSRVAWPLLEVWEASRDGEIREVAERVLASILGRRNENGTFSQWGFRPGLPAFTHTVAYTIRGFLESARIVADWSTYGSPVEAALNRLYRKSELTRGSLPGRVDEAWVYDDSFTCLTGNVQVALCLLRYNERERDLRLLNAACKLVDRVCDSQSLTHPSAGIRGAVSGSSPVWGPYMRLRYPNWAAKFHADALMRVMRELRNLEQ